jgi:hypothetical protein
MHQQQNTDTGTCLAADHYSTYFCGLPNRMPEDAYAAVPLGGAPSHGLK